MISNTPAYRHDMVAILVGAHIARFIYRTTRAPILHTILRNLAS